MRARDDAEAELAQLRQQRNSLRERLELRKKRLVDGQCDGQQEADARRADSQMSERGLAHGQLGHGGSSMPPVDDMRWNEMQRSAVHHGHWQQQQPPLPALPRDAPNQVALRGDGSWSNAQPHTHAHAMSSPHPPPPHHPLAGHATMTAMPAAHTSLRAGQRGVPLSAFDRVLRLVARQLLLLPAVGTGASAAGGAGFPMACSTLLRAVKRELSGRQLQAPSRAQSPAHVAAPDGSGAGESDEWRCVLEVAGEGRPVTAIEAALRCLAAPQPCASAAAAGGTAGSTGGGAHGEGAGRAGRKEGGSSSGPQQPLAPAHAPAPAPAPACVEVEEFTVAGVATLMLLALDREALEGRFPDIAAAVRAGDAGAGGAGQVATAGMAPHHAHGGPHAAAAAAGGGGGVAAAGPGGPMRPMPPVHMMQAMHGMGGMGGMGGAPVHFHGGHGMGVPEGVMGGAMGALQMAPPMAHGGQLAGSRDRPHRVVCAALSWVQPGVALAPFADARCIVQRAAC